MVRVDLWGYEDGEREGLVDLEGLSVPFFLVG